MPSTRDATEVTATSFAPGHLTGIFAPRLDAHDPRARGSVGAGLVLDLGVHATASWRAGARDQVRVRTEPSFRAPISTEVARRLKGDRKGTLRVELRHELPVGQGFGMSAAGALATGLAVARTLGEPKSRAVATAHLADLFGGGGLGGVAAILGGGLELRRSPGIPPWGEIRRRRFPYRVFVSAAGRPLASPALLRDPDFLARVEAAANDGLARLGSHPTALEFLATSEEFTHNLRLASPTLRRTIVALRRTGASVSQAMLGRSWFAVATDPASRRRLILALQRAGAAAVEVGVRPPTA
ncbi:MAG: hypothetical protein L3K05_06075 [Thermoplasmata archaeon]|nr:hypothetical protein [Thermoplasmata archaeon]